MRSGIMPFERSPKTSSPKNLSGAYTRPDSDLWIKALEAEMKSIYDLGVLSGNYIASELRDMGIHKPQD